MAQSGLKSKFLFKKHGKIFYRDNDELNDGTVKLEDSLWSLPVLSTRVLCFIYFYIVLMLSQCFNLFLYLLNIVTNVEKCIKVIII